jgi:hypothetical protein
MVTSGLSSRARFTRTIFFCFCMRGEFPGSSSRWSSFDSDHGRRRGCSCTVCSANRLPWLCCSDSLVAVESGAVCCGFLLERALIFWSLAIDERSGHQDLCSLDHQNVTPYVHRRMRFWHCSCESEPSFDTCEEVSTRSFHSSRSISYNETRGLTSGPELVETLYSI